MCRRIGFEAATPTACLVLGGPSLQHDYEGPGVQGIYSKSMTMAVQYTSELLMSLGNRRVVDDENRMTTFWINLIPNLTIQEIIHDAHEPKWSEIEVLCELATQTSKEQFQRRLHVET